MNKKIFKLGVIGKPIKHSKSPELFKEFAKIYNINLEYKKYLAKNEEECTIIIKKFFNDGGLALNITSPYKQFVLELCDMKSAKVAITKAANLLKKDENGKIIAYSFDGEGLINALKNTHKINIKNKKILIIGSGGVVYSILPDLLQESLFIDILCRNENKLKLNHNFKLNIFDENRTYDIIINTTPNTEDNFIFNNIKFLKNNTFCYDLSYNVNKTIFIQKMLDINKNICFSNGYSMLLEQAKLSFKCIFGVLPK